MTQDVIEVIEKRRTIRKFSGDPVAEATVGRLLSCAHAAPSAGNLQPWHFIVVYNKEIKEALSQAAFNQTFIAEAPVCIVVCAEPGKSAAKYGVRGETLYCLQDTAAAVENLLLAATAYGLGSAWVGAFDEWKVREILQLDAKYRPVAIIPVGYSAEEPEEVPREDLAKVTRILH